MDTLSALLDGPRANGAFLLRSVLSAPWALRVRDEAPLSIAVFVTGEAWVLGDDAEGTHLGPGDVMIARGPQPYTVADAPGPPHTCSSSRASTAWTPTATASRTS